MNRSQDSPSRLKEIAGILARHELVKGITPQKLVAILEDMGPTFVKLGQILSSRPDVLPRDYCQALEKLRSQAAPMPFEEVKATVEASLGLKLEEAFPRFAPQPLGSASIAQAHEARLADGTRVVVKVQRPGIYDTMARDIKLLQRALGLLDRIGGGTEVVDLNKVLDEMWTVAQEEMNFLTEAGNAQTFYRLNQAYEGVSCPRVYPAYSTQQVLTMEYIDGLSIAETDKLRSSGADISELGRRLADNYVKQIVEDGFFHADPHQGNIRIRGGEIVWIDLGMMGRLSGRYQALIGKAIQAVAGHDVALLKDVVLQLGAVKGRVNHVRLYADIDDMLTRYAAMDLGQMDLAQVLQSLMDLAGTHGISMPAGLSMLARGLATIEGVVAQVSPDINVLEVAKARVRDTLMENVNWQEELRRAAGTLYDSGKKSIAIPALASDLMRMATRGQLNVNLTHSASDDLSRAAAALLNRLCLCLLAGFLLLAAALLLAFEKTLPGCLFAAAGVLAALRAFWGELRRKR